MQLRFVDLTLDLMMEVPVMVESEHAVRYAEYLDMLNTTYSQAVDYLLKSMDRAVTTIFERNLINVF